VLKRKSFPAATLAAATTAKLNVPHSLSSLPPAVIPAKSDVLSLAALPDAVIPRPLAASARLAARRPKSALPRQPLSFSLSAARTAAPADVLTHADVALPADLVDRRLLPSDSAGASRTPSAAFAAWQRPRTPSARDASPAPKAVESAKSGAAARCASLARTQQRHTVAEGLVGGADGEADAAADGSAAKRRRPQSALPQKVVRASHVLWHVELCMVASRTCILRRRPLDGWRCEGACSPVLMLLWYAVACSGMQWYAVVCSGMQWHAVQC
jgi:hypothetical protein